jgi:hypothetical protein
MSFFVLTSGLPISRVHFDALLRGCSQEGQAEAHCSGSSIHFIKPNEGSVSVIFPIKFLNPMDVPMGVTFLEQLVEARTSISSLGKSPNCWYHKVGF